MKNITVTVDDDIYRRARIKAAELETSVSALVSGFLREVCASESEFDRLKRLEDELRANMPYFEAGERLSRDELHERRR